MSSNNSGYPAPSGGNLGNRSYIVYNYPMFDATRPPPPPQSASFNRSFNGSFTYESQNDRQNRSFNQNYSQRRGSFNSTGYNLNMSGGHSSHANAAYHRGGHRHANLSLNESSLSRNRNGPVPNYHRGGRGGPSVNRNVSNGQRGGYSGNWTVSNGQRGGHSGNRNVSNASRGGHAGNRNWNNRPSQSYHQMETRGRSQSDSTFQYRQDLNQYRGANPPRNRSSSIATATYYQVQSDNREFGRGQSTSSGQNTSFRGSSSGNFIPKNQGSRIASNNSADGLNHSRSGHNSLVYSDKLLIDDDVFGKTGAPRTPVNSARGSDPINVTPKKKSAHNSTRHNGSNGLRHTHSGYIPVLNLDDSSVDDDVVVTTTTPLDSSVLSNKDVQDVLNTSFVNDDGVSSNESGCSSPTSGNATKKSVFTKTRTSLSTSFAEFERDGPSPILEVNEETGSPLGNNAREWTPLRNRINIDPLLSEQVVSFSPIKKSHVAKSVQSENDLNHHSMDVCRFHIKKNEDIQNVLNASFLGDSNRGIVTEKVPSQQNKLNLSQSFAEIERDGPSPILEVAEVDEESDTSTTDK